MLIAIVSRNETCFTRPVVSRTKSEDSCLPSVPLILFRTYVRVSSYVFIGVPSLCLQDNSVFGIMPGAEERVLDALAEDGGEMFQSEIVRQTDCPEAEPPKSSLHSRKKITRFQIPTGKKQSRSAEN